MGLASWFVVMVIGLVVGGIAHGIARHLRMPLLLNLGIGVIGAFLGAALYQLVRADILGPMSFYVSSGLLAVCISAGSILAYSLTFANKIAR